MKINKEISLSEMLPMEITLRIGDRIVHKGPAHSFLRGYMEDMRALMSAEPKPSETLIRTSVSNGRYLEENDDIITTVALSSGKMRLTKTSHNFQTGDYAYVMGVNTITGGAYLGYQEVTRIDANIIELTNTVGLSGTHSDAVSIPYVRRAELVTDTLISDDWTFSRPQIRCGALTTANTVSTNQLADEIVSLDSSPTGARTFQTTTDPTIATPSVGATDSDIEVEQAFTNASGGTITVNEVGMYWLTSSPSATEHFFRLGIRDVLGAPVTVLDTEVLTVTYNLKTDVPATTGGILVQWNEIFYRQIALTTREAKTIDNLNSVLGNSRGQFRVNSFGGNARMATTRVNGEPGNRIGVQIGGSTTTVVNTNYALQDGVGVDQRFPHGEGTDELWHSGTYVAPVSASGSDVSFVCHKIFDNQSGATVTINDAGLYCGFFYVGSFINYVTAAYCLARFQVSPPIDILNGELAKVEITITITV